MKKPCKICAHPAKVVLKLRNSLKTQTVCRSARQAKKIPCVDLYIYYCANCDFYFTEKMADHYEDEDYFLTTQLSSEQKAYQRSLVSYLEKYMVAPIAEIGPGDGYFGELLQKKHHAYIGFEPAKKSFEECSRKGLMVIRKYFHTTHHKFKTIILRQVLEHIDDLKTFLHDLRGSLRTECGRIILEVPNIAQARIKNRQVDFCPEHLNYFTISSLGYLLTSNGFQVEDIRSTYNDEYLLVIASAKELQFKDTPPVAGLHDLVFWGAGSRGIGFCITAGAKPRYFVDSDPHKHGKFIPYLAIPIISPEKFYADLTGKGVVITSFYYHNEILKELKKNRYRGPIYLLNERNELVPCHKN